MYISQIETILVDIQKRAVCVFTGTVRCIETLTKRARKYAYGIVFRAVCVFTGTSHLIPPVSHSDKGGIW